MSRIALVALGFLTVICLAEAGVRSMTDDLPDLRPWPTPESEIKYAQLERLGSSPTQIDVVFLGTSVIEAGLDPSRFDRSTGLSSYNAALPFSSPLSNEIWLRDFVLQLIHPDTVVIGLGALPDQSTVDDDLLLLGLQGVLGGDVSETGLALVDRRRQLRSWSDTVRRTRQLESGTITDRGHQTVYYERSIPPEELFGSVESEPKSMSRDNFDALGRTIKMLREDGIDVIMLMQPMGCRPIEGVCPAFDLASHPARKLSEDLDLALVDAASRGWPSSFYADSAHFNQTGATAFTDYVSEAFQRVAAAQGDSEKVRERP